MSLRAANKGYSSSSSGAGHYEVMMESKRQTLIQRGLVTRTDDVRTRSLQSSAQIPLRNPTNGSGIRSITRFQAPGAVQMKISACVLEQAQRIFLPSSLASILAMPSGPREWSGPARVVHNSPRAGLFLSSAEIRLTSATRQVSGRSL